jgi:hypothetical protein
MVANNCIHNHTNSYKKVFAMHHSIRLDIREFTRPNINALIEKWIPSYMVWAPRSTSYEYVMRTKRSEEYIS